MKPVSPFMALWGWPIVLAVVSAIGLVGGLWGNGGWDWLAWVGLGLPTAAALWFGLRGRR
jgi:hypothetical protein